MRIDLVDLLQEREIVHPGIANGLIMNDASIVITAEGYPWWKGLRDWEADETIQISLGGIEHATVDYENFFSRHRDNEVFEYLAAGFWSALPWRQGQGREVYCNAPIPDPVSIYHLLADYLRGHDCPFGALEFLNGYTLREFCDIAGSNSFQACDGPGAICDLVCLQLDAQRVPYTALPWNRREPEPEMVWVTFGNSFVVCRTATAEFDD